jgi:hypothetical protein
MNMEPCQGEHDKVYSSKVLTTYPPQHIWICRRCLAEGRDVVVSDMDEYQRLKESKRSDERPLA